MSAQRARPSVWDYMPPPKQREHRPDPTVNLPVGDELQAELVAAIGARLALGERHTHAKRGGGCDTCAEAAADTVVRYLERNTRVVQSDALAPEEHARARAAAKAMPYLGSSRYLRLTGDLGAHPDHPTVDDLLTDLETIGAGLQVIAEQDQAREAELRRYREWRKAVNGLASAIVEEIEQLDPRTPDEEGDDDY